MRTALFLSTTLALTACAPAGMAPGARLVDVSGPVTTGRVLMDVAPYTLDRLDHIDVQVKADGASFADAGTLTPANGVFPEVVLRNLQPKTGYTVRLKAFMPGNLDVTAGSGNTTTFTTLDTAYDPAGSNAHVTVSEGFALRLKDQDFAGEASGAVTATGGVVGNGGTPELGFLLPIGEVSTLFASTNDWLETTGDLVAVGTSTYVVDRAHDRILKVSSAGTATVFCDLSVYDFGFFRGLYGIEYDGTDFYVTRGAKLIKVTAGGTASDVPVTPALVYPGKFAIRGGEFFIGNLSSNQIDKVTVTDGAGARTLFAGTGQTTPKLQNHDSDPKQATFNNPYDLAFDSAGNLFVADWMNAAVRKIATTGKVTTYAGDGTRGFKDGLRAEAQFDVPAGLAIDAQDTLYVADFQNRRVRKIKGANVTTLAGSGSYGLGDSSVGSSAQFQDPQSLAMTPDGALLELDYFNGTIRRIRVSN